MGTKDRAIRHWKQILRTKEPARNIHRAVMGDGSGTVRVSDRKDLVYVRVKSLGDALWKVINDRVADVNGLPVLIEKLPVGDQWQIIDIDKSMLVNVGGGWGGMPYGRAHGETHEWPDGSPGYDVVDVHPRALTPLRCYPKNTSELKVKMAPLRYTYGGELVNFYGGELDLSSYQPASGQARLVLTYLDPITNTPKALGGDATTYSAAITIPRPDVPPYAVTSALVRVTGDRSAFDETDITDYRLILDMVTPERVEDLADVEIHSLSDNQVLTYDTASGKWVNEAQSGTGVTDAQYLVLTLDATLSDERRFVDGTGLTGTDGGAGGDYTVDLDIDSLTGEATADDADTIAIHDDSAGAVRKQTRANFLSDKAPIDAQYLVLSYSNSLTAERLVAPGAGLKGTDSGADDAYTLELDIGELPTETDPASDDWFLIYDKSGSSHKKMSHVDVTADSDTFTVTNTSGASASAGEIGYVDATGEYKTTTTAYADAAWCVVVEGGANNANVRVARRGQVTVTLNDNCSAGDYLYTSTTAGQAQPQSYTRPELFAVALTANGDGAGGTCEALLLCHTRRIQASDSNDIFRVNTHSDTDFVATINGAPVGAAVVYNAPSAGAEDVINVAAGTQLGKIRLYNSTDGDYALIDSVNTGTNTITLTANAPAGWANGETITIRSQTCNSGGSPYFLDIDLSSADNTAIPILARNVILEVGLLDTGGAGYYDATHPWEAYAASKQKLYYTPTTQYTFRQIEVGLFQRRFCWRSDASGSGTKNSIIRLAGYDLAVP